MTICLAWTFNIYTRLYDTLLVFNIVILALYGVFYMILVKCVSFVLFKFLSWKKLREKDRERDRQTDRQRGGWGGVGWGGGGGGANLINQRQRKRNLDRAQN